MLAEVAVAVVLLVGASLFTRSFLRVNETATGFDSTHLLLVNVSGTESGRRRADSRLSTERCPRRFSRRRLWRRRW